MAASYKDSGKSGSIAQTMLVRRTQLATRNFLLQFVYLEVNSFSTVWVMASKTNFEQTATSIAALDRVELKRRIKNFKGRFKLDFNEDYLNSLSVDRLRHILLAALINAKPHN